MAPPRRVPYGRARFTRRASRRALELAIPSLTKALREVALRSAATVAGKVVMDQLFALMIASKRVVVVVVVVTQQTWAAC